MAKARSSTRLLNKRTFRKHPKVIRNEFDAKLNTKQASNIKQTGNIHSH
jgi:hypothetical protein